MIINIRGSHGSGKSYTVWKLIKHFGIRETITKHRRVIGYRLKSPTLGPDTRMRVYVIGQYKKDAPSNAGCDAFKGYHNLFKPGFNQADLVCKLVRKYAKRGHVIFEGLVFSSAQQRTIDLAKKLQHQHHQVIFGFPDVSLRRTLKQIEHRRAKNPRHLPPLKRGGEVIKKKYEEIHVRGWKRLVSAGLDARLIPRYKPHRTILAWLSE